MTRVKKLAPSIVYEVKPDEEKDVDAHPDHLQTQMQSPFRRKIDAD